MNTKIALAALLVALVPACNATAGKISAEVYTSPGGEFSMSLPLPRTTGRRVQDDRQENQWGFVGYVSFFNDFGMLRRVDYGGKADGSTGLEQPGDVQSFYDQVVVFPITDQFPDATREEEQLITLEGGEQVYFGVVQIPGGSVLVNGEVAGERHDTTRAFLVFGRNGVAYSLSWAEGLLLQEEAADPDAELIARWKQGLLALRASMTFH